MNALFFIHANHPVFIKYFNFQTVDFHFINNYQQYQATENNASPWAMEVN